MDLDRISRLLRRLTPRQEKVTRLYFGLGCQRAHSAQELAEEFGVSAPVIAGILGAAQKSLAQVGLTASHLREAAQQTRLTPRSHSSIESPSKIRHRSHSHHKV